MPNVRPTRTPSYRKHRASGQAIVTLNGKMIYLGPFGSVASKAEYDRLIAEWLAAGRRLSPSMGGEPEITVGEVIAKFWEHAQAWYRRPDETHTSELQVYRDALKPLRKLYATTDANAFGPLALKAVIGEMVRLGWCRTTVNKQIVRIKHVFKWAVGQELVQPSVFQGLLAVSGLRIGRTEAPEPEPVRPVPTEQVDAVLPHLSSTVQAMIRLQRLTGMRPGELVIMRTVDVNTTVEVWEYQPSSHKSQWRGHDRSIFMGPRAQECLSPFLRSDDPSAYVFDPADSVSERRAERHANRTTPLSYGNSPGTNRARRPERAPGERYTVASYRRAIERGCDAAFPAPGKLPRAAKIISRWKRTRKGRALPKVLAVAAKELAKWRAEHRWHPHQLRHATATELRKTYGLEAAQVQLGHRTLSATQIYAERDVAAARRVMGAVG